MRASCTGNAATDSQALPASPVLHFWELPVEKCDIRKDAVAQQWANLLSPQIPPAVCSEDKEEPSDYHAVQFEADICLTLSLSARSGWRRAAERSRSWARLLAPDPAAAAGFVCRGSKRNALKGSERPCQMFPVLFQSRKGAFSLRSVQSNFSTL